MVLDLDDGGAAELRRPDELERRELLERPDVAAYRDAFLLADLEDRLELEGGLKEKAKMGGRRRTRSGDRLRFEARGPG